MAKITALPVAGPLDGSEDVPLVQDGETRRINPADHLAYIARGAEMARDQAADLVLPQHIFVDTDLATAHAAVADGTVFKMVSSATGLAEVRKRTVAGSDLLYEEMTTAALESPLAATKLGSEDGTVQSDIDRLGNLSSAYIARALPPDFAWFDNPFNIPGCPAPGMCRTGLDAQARFRDQFAGLFDPAKVRWISPTGSDANSGLGPQQAWKTAGKAANTIDAHLCLFAPGKYYQSDLKIDRSVSNAAREWVAMGDVRFYGGQDPAPLPFSVAPPHVHTYAMEFATADPVEAVLDELFLDRFGQPTRMPEYVDKAAVDLSGYGWSYDADNRKLYVRSGLRNLAADRTGIDIVFGVSGVTEANPFGTMPRIVDQAVHWRGIKLVGTGLRLISVLRDGRCHFFSRGVQTLFSRYKGYHADGGFSWLQEMVAHDSDQDNFSYYSSGAEDGAMIEIDCVSRRAGTSMKWEPENPNKNASTIHHRVRGIRINGDYRESYGPCIADTGTGGSYNVGVGVFRPLYADLGAFYASSPAWLDTCAIDAGIRQGLPGSDLYADGAAIKAYRTSYSSAATNGGGSVSGFTPF